MCERNINSRIVSEIFIKIVNMKINDQSHICYVHLSAMHLAQEIHYLVTNLRQNPKFGMRLCL